MAQPCTTSPYASAGIRDPRPAVAEAATRRKRDDTAYGSRLADRDDSLKDVAAGLSKRLAEIVKAIRGPPASRSEQIRTVCHAASDRSYCVNLPAVAQSC